MFCYESNSTEYRAALAVEVKLCFTFLQLKQPERFKSASEVCCRSKKMEKVGPKLLNIVEIGYSTRNSFGESSKWTDTTLI